MAVQDEGNKGAFCPLRDAARIRGLVDRTTANLLTSTAPNPTQASLNAVLNTTTRVRVVGFSWGPNGRNKHILLDVSDTPSVQEFRACFAIDEAPEMFDHCFCMGNPHLELYAGKQLVASIGCHHGILIRWDAWKWDARLKEPERHIRWLSERGETGLEREVEDRLRRKVEYQRERQQWQDAMPLSLRPFADQMFQRQATRLDSQQCREWHDALCAAMPELRAQILCLLEWFGSGAGPWSGYPAYEEAAEALIALYPTPLVVEAAQGATNDRQQAGAARYFASWDFVHVRGQDLDLIPANLKAILLAVTRNQGNPDNIARATKAFTNHAGHSGR